MTKMIQSVAAHLTPAQPQAIPGDINTPQPRSTHLTRDEMEMLFARELGRVRFH